MPSGSATHQGKFTVSVAAPTNPADRIFSASGPVPFVLMTVSNLTAGGAGAVPEIEVIVNGNAVADNVVAVRVGESRTFLFATTPQMPTIRTIDIQRRNTPNNMQILMGEYQLSVFP